MASNGQGCEMSDHLKKVQSGDRLKIPAATFNTFIDAARDFRARQQGRAQNAQPGLGSSGIVLVKNASGYDQDRFAVLGIDSPVITPTDNEDEFKNKVALISVTPTEANHTGKFVILLEPIQAGEIGLACAHGVCPVKIYISDEGHAYADVNDGQAGSLASAETGAALILWRENGTGEKWAIIKLGVPPGGGTTTFPARLTASLGGGKYTGKEQTYNGTSYSDKSGASDITITNVAETAGNCTSPINVANNPIVLVTPHGDYYLCDRATNAQYREST